MRIIRVQLRAPADLAAAASFQTAPINMHGARHVALFARATNANALAAATFEVAPEDVVTSPNTWYNPSGPGFTTQGAIAASALNAGGFKMALFLNPVRESLWRAVRGNFTGHATLTITQLEIWAEVAFPNQLNIQRDASINLLSS